MTSIDFGTVLLPQIWKPLLAIGNFEELAVAPARFRESEKISDANHACDPTPFRDDERVVSVERDGFVASFFLHSGDNNYWLEYNVHRKTEAGSSVTENDIMIASEPLHQLPIGETHFAAPRFGCSITFVPAAAATVTLDDQDQHEEGCDCGLCNANGKAYGAAIFQVGEDDPVERVYAASEDSALLAAKVRAGELSLIVIEAVS